MDIIITRRRLGDIPSRYEYRPLVPFGQMTRECQRYLHPVQAPAIAGGQSCARLAQIIAPISWYAEDIAGRFDLAARIGLVASRAGALLVGAIFPEMTAHRLQIDFSVDHKLQDAAVHARITDLTGAFERLEASLATLTAHDLGLARDISRRAA